MDARTTISQPVHEGPPEIAPSEIKFNEETDFLGEGVFGKVFKGQCRKTPVAVKVPHIQQLTDEQLDDFRREVNIMRQIFHPNVVLFMGACTEPGSIKIVTELMTTDMDKLIQQWRTLQNGKMSDSNPGIPSLTYRLKMAKDSAKGMSWLHGINNIIHRDLKPANLLVDTTLNVVKVADFGFSQVLKGGQKSKDLKGPIGSASWMAPEVMANHEFDFKADVYAFGIILWQFYTLQEPYDGLFDDWDDFHNAICNIQIRPEIPEDCPDSLRSLITQCWHADPHKRPTFVDIVIRLDEVILDIAIEDKTYALNFWRKYFLIPKQQLQEEIDWKDFTTACAQETGLDRIKFEMLKPYLVVVSNTEFRVTIRQFNYSVRWFDYYFVYSESSKTMEKIRILLSKPWFHGMIDQKEADGRLSAQLQGTFLVRMSTTIPEFPFTLSLPHQRHVRLRKERGKTGVPIFSVTNVTTTWPDLLEMILGIMTPLGLTKACPKTPARDAYST